MIARGIREGARLACPLSTRLRTFGDWPLWIVADIRLDSSLGVQHPYVSGTEE